MSELTPANTQALNKVKDRIWKVATTPKIRMFLWRALSGALAVATCLRRHGLDTQLMCKICNVSEETVTQVFFGCTLATQVWASSALPIPNQGFSTNLQENIVHVLNLMEKVDIPLHLRESIPWLLWRIWKDRNCTLYANKVNDHHLVIC